MHMLRLLKKEESVIRSVIVGPSRRWMTTVYSFGDGSQGALGLPNPHLMAMGSDVYEPTSISGLPDDVSSVSSGHYHSIAVTSQGELWAWGRNNEAQLGRSPLSPRETWNEPKKVEGLTQVKVQAAFASGVISAAIGDDGSLWVWGKSKRGQLGLGKGVMESILPSRVESLAGEGIVKVSLGWGHALALTKCGKLFGWGYLADCRLGNFGKISESSPLDSTSDIVRTTEEISSSMLEAAEKLVMDGMEKEKDMPIIWDPSLIEDVHGTEVVDISCGLDHSLVLCRDGTLLSGGSNAYNQLGRLRQDLGLLPVELNACPVSIASGLGHSLAVCRFSSPEIGGQDLSVVTWGWNQSLQLGREGPENLPLVVKGMAGEKPKSVSGGRVHSIALTAKGEVWVWGCGRNGRLGLGSSINEAKPVLLEYLEGSEVLQAVAGFDHNLILTTD